VKNFFDWNSVEEEIVKPGIKRKIVTGKNIMLVLYEIEPGHGISEQTFLMEAKPSAIKTS